MYSNTACRNSLSFFNIIFLAFFAGSMLFASSASGQIYYVDAASTAASPDGKNWASAYKDLQSAVNEAADAGGGEVWVAQGTYISTTNPVLTMKEKVALYGGFTGTESSLSQRDWNARLTVIDGEGTRRCVIGASDAILDGFTLSNGKASYGAGMYNTYSSPIITNCTFMQNNASYSSGGGMYNTYSSPIITNCTFTKNTATEGGGGMYNAIESSPTITNCTFTENTASEGGAIRNNRAAPIITNCTFAENTASEGGAIRNNRAAPIITNCTFTENTANESGGGMYSYERCSPVVTNCIFTKNNAPQGGAIKTRHLSESEVINCHFLENTATEMGGGIYIHNSSQIVTNCVFSGNTAAEEGGGIIHSYSSSGVVTNCTFTKNTAPQGAAMRNYRSQTTVGATNCIFWDNGSSEIDSEPESDVTITFSCIKGGHKGRGNINKDPRFLDAPTILQLHPESPCIDAGTMDGAPATDILGRPRPQGAGIDMGAYEGADVVTLTVQCEPEIFGQTDPPAGSTVFFRGVTVPLQAIAKHRATFSHWTGDLIGNENPTSLLMDRDKTVTAHFNPRIYYVNAASTAEHPDGSSWKYAYKDLQTAVNAAETAGGGAVWTARGVYSGGYEGILMMKRNVALYGGFAGTESSLDQRDWNAYPTVIDGEDTRRCVIGASDALLDGFTLSNGQADNGAGMYNDNTSPTVINCNFTNNEASKHGGAMHNAKASPIVTNCAFTENTADYGGALHNVENASPIVTNCTFTNHYAGWSGGAMYNNSAHATVKNCIFTENVASDGAGIYNITSSPEVTNCIFTQNSSSDGVGIYNSLSSPVVTNCSFTLNHCMEGGVISSKEASSPEVKNCIFWENDSSESISYSESTTVSYSCVQGGFPGVGNIDDNPLFVRAPSILQLRADSPCVDTGTADGAPEADILGRPRPQGAGIDMGAYEGAVAEEDLVTLTLHCEPETSGRTEPPAGSILFVRGDIASLQAYNRYGAVFSHWTGDLGGNENPVPLLMDSDKTVTAHFDPTVYYVNAASIADNPDGSSWENAYPDLQTAVDAAEAAGGGEVWVAQGNYTSNNDPVLTMKEGIALYGGFAGTESTLDERDWNAYPTVINGEDTRRCVRGANDAILDGFTLSNGKADAGAGMYTNNASPTVTNCMFTKNTASNGGGMYNHNASPLITNCNFIKNEALYAGAMVNATSSSPEIINCTFTENKALYLGGGMAIIGSSPIVTNCNFTKNEAEQGGAMFNQDAHPEVTNCTFTENEALYDGGSMYNYYSSPEIVNSILWGNGPTEIFNDPHSSTTITYSCIQGYYPGEGNIDEDPLFVNAPSNLQLLPASPCIDAGTPDDAPDTDILGNLRPLGPGIDMGAYEFTGYHPADKNGDWRIDQQEAADYLEEWQVRDAPMRTAIQAAFIQQSGEEYEYDYNKPEPECWQPLTKP